MPRILTAFLTCLVSASLAAGAALGFAAALNAPPAQPTTPLVTFPDPLDEPTVTAPQTYEPGR